MMRLKIGMNLSRSDDALLQAVSHEAYCLSSCTALPKFARVAAASVPLGELSVQR